MLSTDLLKGRSQSCGCLRADNRQTRKGFVRLPPGEPAFRMSVGHYKCSAIKRKLAWTLSQDEARQLMGQTCHYCGGVPRNMSIVKGYEPFIYNGLDRVDSAGGYTIDNVVTCCTTCNYAKGKQSYQEFMEWIERLRTYRRTLKSS